MNNPEVGILNENNAEVLEPLNSMAWLTLPQMLRKAAVILGLITIDLFSMAVVIASSIEIRLELLPLIYPYFPDRLPEHLAQYSWAFMGLWLLCMYYEGLYTKRLPFWEEARKVLRAITLTFILAFAIVSLMKLGGEVSRTVLLMGYLLALPSVPLGRYLAKTLLGYVGLWNETCLIAGTGPQARMIVEALAKDHYLGYSVKGLVGVSEAESVGMVSIAGKEYQVLGSIHDLPGILKRHGIRHVVIAAPDLTGPDLVSAVSEIQPYTRSILVVPDWSGIPVIGGEAEYFFNERMLAFRTRNNLASRANVISKRAFDVIVGSLLLLLSFPGLILIALLIRLETPGTIVFAHPRLGKNGQAFKCFKFRSMVINAGELLPQLLRANPDLQQEWDRDFKLKDDPRVTRIGRILRKTSLDEMPQLINVLKGEMSLVGPRPIVAEEIARFGGRARDYMMVLPGITGLWQVSGRNDIDYEERVMMEAWYVRNWSMWLDISLLFRTIGVVLSRRGAY